MGKVIDPAGPEQHIGGIASRIIEKAGAKFVKEGERVYTGGTITMPGIYRSVAIDDYHGNVDLFDGFSISSSGLRAVIRRPSEYWGFSPYNPTPFEREEKSSLEFGKAAHMLVLGEDGFKSRYGLASSHLLR